MTKEILQIIIDAGQIILNAENIDSGIESKQGRANFVTSYDYMVQEYLFGHLKQVVPDAVFIGEEGSETDAYDSDKCFIIDPIDGTTNFIFGFKHSAISVGYLENGEAVFGAVYNPFMDEIFYAEKDKGAYLRTGCSRSNPVKAANKPEALAFDSITSNETNDKRLHIKDISLKEGITAFGTSPYTRELAGRSFELARKLYDYALDIRRTGSAALDICYVASGRYALYTELTLSPWDYAAGTIILKEAGGIITTLDKEPITFSRPISVVAAAPKAYEDFFRFIY